ncbi:DMT family transporter [Barnesiella sp. An55]|uniref:DMT family transporter n=1 Tax=Barnesiella sp. An55 TaxID=1965646 RepID=UPI000B379577|nr:DMT family transporter [Barnesiella sp. An55]OUN72505.1 EamA family transporter [Barnesiella sp. An55]HIZ25625.1 DMT family transporter [Candidatus Barnesiella merdipullorum]
MKVEKWLMYAWVTTLLWGVWGAFSEMPTKAGFPATLGYIVWAISMIPCAVVALWRNGWKLDVSFRAVFYGLMVGLLGAAGQLILFQALRIGPAYIIFPFVSMSPVVTIALSLWLLKERPNKRQKWGIVVALLAIFFLSVQQGGGEIEGGMWLVMATGVFVMWGVQAYFMKLGNKVASAESIFVYMTIAGVLLIPVAYYMTDFSLPMNTSFSWVSATFIIQLLNAIGALTLVYAYRYGKAVIVSPLTGLAPLITVVLSLIIYAVFPGTILLIGLILATIAMVALAD